MAATVVGSAQIAGTLTSKRITKRVSSTANAATITPDCDSYDLIDITAIAQAFTIANPTGTPTNGQELQIRIKDNATARAITWGSNYVEGTGTALPATTVLSKILNLTFQYNTANALNKWQLISVAQESASAAGGLTNFTESTATYSSQVYVSLVPNNAASNVNAIFGVKGNGYLSAQIPNGAASGGNQRGIYATDWQHKRSAADQVASGTYSTIAGGYGNKASSQFSLVGGGYFNTASGYKSTVGGGRENAASATYTTICGGRSNTASNNSSTVGGGRNNASSGNKATIGGGGYNTCSGSYATVAGGRYNLASGDNSTIFGGYQASTRGIYGMAAIASGKFGTKGDSQAGQYILRGLTTDATPKVLTTNQSTAGTLNQIILPNNSSYVFNGIFNAHRTDVVGTSASFTFSGCIRRGANAASTTLVAAVTPTSLASDAGGVTWALAVTADTTNGGLAVTFTGEAAKTIRSVCVIETCEITS